MAALGPGPPGLGGTSVNLPSQRLDFFCSETEQRQLVVEETGPGVPGGRPLFSLHKSCLYASSPPTCASLKCISCKTVEESYLPLQHKASISCFQMHKKVFKKYTCSQEDTIFSREQ